ncbi:glycosyltransferase involved in cell wall biosynthesis [Roseateles toxinivorans]|uniref:Glycosyltransferase involved in cell wall biosynthesis n=1 Tax=Roseateles toxinivorans TaxID=270368 RepID=A0A4R6QNE4_9BURK|nr:glycosyltransferase involved in cell wall biosynthesis [Roseateles toxinivorans]
MRVLQLNNFEAIGGGSDRVYQLTTRLLRSKGHQVATLACGDEPFDKDKQSHLLPRNGYIERNPLATLRNIRDFVYRPAAAAMIDEIVETHRPEVAHLHIFYGQLSSSVLQRLRHHRVPCVMTVHEYRMLCPVSTLFTEREGVCEKCAGGQLRHVVLNRCNRGSLAASMLSALECSVRDRRFNYLEHVDHFLMVSHFCRDKHIQYLPAIADKSSVLYNFVAAEPERSDFEQPGADRRYLYCGRLSREKGVSLLCDSFAQRPTETLLLAGDGPLGDELRARYADCPNIRFLGKLGAAELASQIRQAWFTIAPSEWYENNPMAILESFALGTPVLAADIGGIPELVIPGETGLLFAPSDPASLARSLDTASLMPPEERARLSARAVQMIAAHHGPEHHYQLLMAGYAKAIEQHNQGSRA